MNILHTVFCANGLHQINWVKILNNFQSRPQTFSYINISNFHYKLLFRKCFVTTTSPVCEGKSNKIMNRSSLIFLLRFIQELRNKTSVIHSQNISENWNTCCSVSNTFDLYTNSVEDNSYLYNLFFCTDILRH